jgi:hypothetical protein
MVRDMPAQHKSLFFAHRWALVSWCGRAHRLLSVWIASGFEHDLPDMISA